MYAPTEGNDRAVFLSPWFSLLVSGVVIILLYSGISVLFYSQKRDDASTGLERLRRSSFILLNCWSFRNSTFQLELYVF